MSYGAGISMNNNKTYSSRQSRIYSLPLFYFYLFKN